MLSLFHIFVLFRACISGEQYSSKPRLKDGQSYKYRVTDILISLGGPEDEIQRALIRADINFQLYDKPF